MTASFAGDRFRPTRRIMRPVGRADLMQLIDELGLARARQLAHLLDFEAPPAEPGDAPTVDHRETDREAAKVSPPPDAPAVSIDERPLAPVPCWLPARLEPVGEEPEPLVGPGLELADVCTDPDVLPAPPAHEPLMPWSRLWSRLRERLLTTAPGVAVDVQRLVRNLASGVAVRRVPRRRQRRWASRVSIWVDASTRLGPFAPDSRDVIDRLRSAIGAWAVDVRFIVDRDPAEANIDGGDLTVVGDSRIDWDSPVLLLGDVGACSPRKSERAVWQRTTERLGWQRHRFTALVPVPRSRWGAQPVEAWNPLAWSPDVARDSAASEEQWQRERDERATQLLRLASLATVVEPELLRALRLLLGFDAAAEVDAWSHPAVACAAPWLILHPGHAASWRKELAEQTDRADRALAARARVLVRRWHARSDAALRHTEAMIWRGVTGDHPVDDDLDATEAAAEAKALEDSLAFAGRLHRTAAGRDDVGTRRYGQVLLPSLPAEVLRAPVVGEALQRIYASCYQGIDGPVPAGIDRHVLEAERRRIEQLTGGGGGPIDPGELWQVRQVGRMLRFERAPASHVWDQGPPRPGSPVAWLRAAGERLTVWWLGQDRGEPKGRNFTLGQGLEVALVGESGVPGDVAIVTDRSTLTLERLVKPEPWACGMGRDRHGLWADADILGVIQRFRYVPPGTVRLGSPEGEEGRFDDEGPTHPVTWTRGYWLADTPVTQALWEAVMGGNKNPSEFMSATRPVEKVSWQDCHRFIEVLARREEALEPRERLEARMPSEAEWEYACRGGTETATWRGDLKILGENNAPLLDEIAWYGGNSGVGFELAKGVSSRGWPNKQYAHGKAGTRPVATRAANPLGLHDMLGNVWEWCADTYGPYEAGAQEDPRVREGAGSRRVMRGGSWSDLARYVRAAARNAWHPGNAYSSLGFRLARGPAPGQAGLVQPPPRSGGGGPEPTRSGGQAAEGRGRPAPAERDAKPAPARKRRGKP